MVTTKDSWAGWLDNCYFSHGGIGSIKSGSLSDEVFAFGGLGAILDIL